MADQFYTIITTIGKAKLANAQATGIPVNFSEIAVGDGNGSHYNPTENQIELLNEVWRGPLNTIYTNEENPGYLYFEGVIPDTDGGFSIRECGIFDTDGDLIFIGNLGVTYKPTLPEGSTSGIAIKTIIQISNTENVTLQIDPSSVIAMQSWVNNNFLKQIDAAALYATIGHSEHPNGVETDIISDISGNGINIGSKIGINVIPEHSFDSLTSILDENPKIVHRMNVYTVSAATKPVSSFSRQQGSNPPHNYAGLGGIYENGYGKLAFYAVNRINSGEFLEEDIKGTIDRNGVLDIESHLNHFGFNGKTLAIIKDFDANIYANPGIYVTIGDNVSTTNMPVINPNGTLIVEKVSGNQTIQKYYQYDGISYMRSRWGATWYNWRIITN